MTEQFWVQLIVFVIGGLVFIVTNSFIVGAYVSKLATKAELKSAVEERDNKIVKVHEHIEREMKDINNDFVRKEICGLSHKNQNEQNDRWEKAFADFRHDMRDAVQKLTTWNEAMIVNFHEFKAEVKELIKK